MSQFDTAVNALEGLSDADMRRLKARLEHRLVKSEDGFIPHEADKELYFSLQEAWFKYKDTPIPKHLSVFLRNFSLSEWHRSVEWVEGFISRSCRRGLTVSQRRALLDKLASYLVCYQEWEGPYDMVANIMVMRHAVDEHFPGYAQAGLLYLLVPIASEQRWLGEVEPDKGELPPPPQPPAPERWRASIERFRSRNAVAER